MKIIDLFTKIANKEEVPKKISYNHAIYIYNEGTKQYYIEGCMGMFENSLRYELTSFNKLNDEVEIIEENKIEIDKDKLFIDEKDAYTYIYNKLIEVADVVNKMSVNK